MTALPLPQHPILGCVAELEAALDGAADAQAIYLSTDEKAAALVRLAKVEARVAGLRLGVMAAAGDVAEETGARDVAAWLAHHTLAEPDAARADDRLAQSLDRQRHRVADALAEGRCSLAQARVIVRALDELPDRVGREVIASAEETLVAYAEQFRPSQLRVLGRRILDIVAPEIADAEEARRLACTAQIIPAVLGGDSEVLDLGRTRRLFSPAQRKALRLRDQRCRGEGCTIPATWTEAHHLESWHTGGPTDLANAILLCSHHHHRAHDTRYQIDRVGNGDLRFTRRR
jgi:hypothetical protein